MNTKIQIDKKDKKRVMLIYRRKHAGAELCQAQVKLGIAKVEVFFHLIEIKCRSSSTCLKN
jgi:hypothetical protein